MKHRLLVSFLATAALVVGLFALVLVVRKEFLRRSALETLVTTGSTLRNWSGPLSWEKKRDFGSSMTEMRAHWLSFPAVIATGEGNGVGQQQIGEAIRIMDPEILILDIEGAVEDSLMRSVAKAESLAASISGCHGMSRIAA